MINQLIKITILMGNFAAHITKKSTSDIPNCTHFMVMNHLAMRTLRTHETHRDYISCNVRIAMLPVSSSTEQGKHAAWPVRLYSISFFCFCCCKSELL